MFDGQLAGQVAWKELIVERFVARREEYFLKFVTSLRLNCVVVNKEQYPECSSISEMDTKAAHYEAGITLAQTSLRRSLA